MQTQRVKRIPIGSSVFFSNPKASSIQRLAIFFTATAHSPQVAAGRRPPADALPFRSPPLPPLPAVQQKFRPSGNPPSPGGSNRIQGG